MPRRSIQQIKEDEKKGNRIISRPRKAGAKRTKPVFPTGDNSTHRPQHHHVPLPASALSIEELDELRAKHPKITDEEHDLVSGLLQTGLSIADYIKKTGQPKNTVYSRLSRDRVIAYRNDMALKALGWFAVDALSVMRNLLKSKKDFIRLEAAKDLMDRSGFSLAAPKVSNAVAIKIGLDYVKPVSEG